MSADSKYKEFYDNAPTYSEAIAALQDKECPEQVVADVLSFKISPTEYESETVGEPCFADLLSTGLSERTLSGTTLDQMCNSFASWLIDESTEFGVDDMYGFSHYEVLEGNFLGLFEQKNLSVTAITDLLNAMEVLATSVVSVQDSGGGEEEGVSFGEYFSRFAEIFEALAVHPNATQEQKDKFLELSTLMKEKEAEVAED
jgi:hypothetical protein